MARSYRALTSLAITANRDDDAVVTCDQHALSLREPAGVGIGQLEMVGEVHENSAVIA